MMRSMPPNDAGAIASSVPTRLPASAPRKPSSAPNGGAADVGADAAADPNAGIRTAEAIEAGAVFGTGLHAAGAILGLCRRHVGPLVQRLRIERLRMRQRREQQGKEDDGQAHANSRETPEDCVALWSFDVIWCSGYRLDL